MRRAVILTSLVLAGCGGEAPKQAEAPKAAATELSAGQWEVATEVTQFTQMDKGKAAIDTPAGTRATETVCVGAGEGKQPPAALLAGSNAYTCTYNNHYMSSGTLNTQLDCRREGVSGQVMMSLDGSYTADTLEANQSLTTYLPGQGDVRIQSKVTGRRTGECTAAPAEPKAA
jgi:outer membrane murein-binding lipoprotein Lpp